MLARLTGASTEIDLTKTKFDPANQAHISAINNHIKSFNEISLSLFKKDLLIMVPASFFMSLWVTGVFGLISEGIALGVCAVLVWASDLWQRRVIESQECQAELKDMLAIYRKCIADHGYQITSNTKVLELLATIAPYVSTRALWEVNAANPVDYPDGFKQILSSPPHRIPFGDNKQAEGSVLSALSSVLPFPASHQVNIAEVPITQISNLGAISLFKKMAADTRQTMYGLDEKSLNEVLSNKR